MSGDESKLCEEIKQIIVDRLRLEGLTPDQIDTDAPLFGGGLGLDSVDALELVVGLERAFGITIKSHEVDKGAFASVRTLAQFVEAARAGRPDGAGAGGA